MSGLPCPVTSCRREMPGATTICAACAGDLARDLGKVPGLAVELDVSLAKQTPGSGQRGSGERGLPYDLGASEAADQLRAVLVGWVRVLQDERSEAWPVDVLAEMARWLSMRLGRLERHPAAVETHWEITDAVRRAEKAVDRPEGRTYAGPCDECQQDLYAKPGATLVRCKGCGWECGVEARQEWLWSQLDDRLAGAADVAHVVSGQLGITVSAERVRQWAARGRIVGHGTDRRGRRLYQIGEVRQMVMEATRRDVERKAEKAKKAKPLAPQVRAVSH